MTRLFLIVSAAIPLTLGLAACDPTTPNGPIDEPEECPADDGFAQIISAEIDGDTLIANIAHSGCDQAEVVTPCWDGSFMESFPVQANVDLSIGPAQACLAYFEYETEVDLRGIRQAYEDSYGPGPGSVILNLDGTSVLYEF